mgnify:CR=1 FL=1
MSPRLLSLLAAILLAICWSAPVRAQDEIVIPDFKGLTVAQATLRILDLGVLSEFVNDMSCTGTELIVSNQTPVAGVHRDIRIGARSLAVRRPAQAHA